MSTRTQAFVNFYAAMGTLYAYSKLDEKQGTGGKAGHFLKV